MNCNETFNAGICYVTDAYKRVCRFNEELHADLGKYRAENAKLRELLLDVADVLEEHTKLRELAERLRSAVSDGADNARDVLAENAELRNLLLSVWDDAIQFDGFWDYVHDDGTMYREDELPHYQDRMRELGIEVE